MKKCNSLAFWAFVALLFSGCSRAAWQAHWQRDVAIPSEYNYVFEEERKADRYERWLREHRPERFNQDQAALYVPDGARTDTGVLFLNPGDFTFDNSLYFDTIQAGEPGQVLRHDGSRFGFSFVNLSPADSSELAALFPDRQIVCPPGGLQNWQLVDEPESFTGGLSLSHGGYGGTSKDSGLVNQPPARIAKTASELYAENGSFFVPWWAAAGFALLGGLLTQIFVGLLRSKRRQNG